MRRRRLPLGIHYIPQKRWSPWKPLERIKFEDAILAWHITWKYQLRTPSLSEPDPNLTNKPVLPGYTFYVSHAHQVQHCHWGLHGSVRVTDALSYATGGAIIPDYILHRVLLWGRVRFDYDKIVASNRTVLWSLNLMCIDASERRWWSSNLYDEALMMKVDKALPYIKFCSWLDPCLKGSYKPGRLEAFPKLGYFNDPCDRT